MRLDPARHDWMTARETRAVMDALGTGRARFVGGCVRNALMGRPVEDIDIATSLKPDAVMAALEAAGLRAVPTGIDHGTVTAVSGGRAYEVTTLRRDVETHGRHAVVAFTTDWAEDAARRDFRLNAIYADADGTVHDPGGGLDDIAARRVVFIGEARARIREDYLRILRFYRFTAWYARAMDADGHAACVDERAGLQALSRERVWKEWKTLLAAPDPGPMLEAMRAGNVLKEVLPGALDLNVLLGIIRTDMREALPPDSLLRTAALLDADGDRMRAVCTAMKASNVEKARLSALATRPPARAGADVRTRRAHLYRLGAEAFGDQIRLGLAAGEGEADALKADLDAAAAYERPAMPVRGGDLVRLGVETGPAVSRTLKALEADWIASDFTLDRGALLKRAAEQGR